MTVAVACSICASACKSSRRVMYIPQSDRLWVLQCYLKDAAARIETDMQRAAMEGWKFGAKTVRGAYMVVERARAAEKGYESPIWDSSAGDARQLQQVCLRLCSALCACSSTRISAPCGTVVSHRQHPGEDSPLPDK